ARQAGDLLLTQVPYAADFTSLEHQIHKSSLSTTTHQSHYHSLHHHIPGVGVNWIHQRVRRLQADALSFVVQPLQCHFAVHAGHHHFAVLGALPAGDDHVVAVEDSIVHHRVAAHFQNEVLSARRQTFGNGDRLVGLLHLERLSGGDRSEQRKLTHPWR